MQKVLKVFQASAIYRLCTAVAVFFNSQWVGSAFISRFMNVKERTATSGMFSSAVAKMRRAQLKVFKTLRLDKLLRGSLFTFPAVYCCAVVALTALVPTKISILLTVASFGTLFLRLGADSEYRIPAHPVNKYVLLYAVVYAAGTLMSVSFRDSLYGGALLVFFAMFAIAAQYSLRTKREVYAAVYALIFGGFAVSCHGIFQYVYGVDGASAWLDTRMFSGMTRVYATLGNPNVLSEYLLLVIPFGAAFFVTAKNALTRIIALGMLFAMLLCMGLTLARGGWLGVMAAAAIFLIMLDRRLILLGIAGLIALYFMLPDAFMERLASIGNLKDGSTSYRVSIWFGTIAMLREYWFIGIGPGTAAFNRVYPLYAYNAIYAPHSHNLFLQLMCDAGIFSLIIFIPLLFSLLRTLARGTGRTADKTARVFRIAAIASIAGFLVQSATDYSFYNYRVALIFWAVVGIAAALTRNFSDIAEDGG